MCKAAPEEAIRALLQAGAVEELFASNMKRGSPADRTAARQLLWRLAQQVGTTLLYLCVSAFASNLKCGQVSVPVFLLIMSLDAQWGLVPRLLS